jgi:Flp pilus assembly protein TadD
MRKKRLVKSYRSQKARKKREKKQMTAAILHLGMVSGTVVVLTLTAINLIKSAKKPTVQYRQIVLGTNDDIEKRLEFWQDILSETPSYLPGIVEAAKIEILKGNFSKAVELIERAENLSPNDQKVKELRLLFKKSLS